ncbi:MAG: Mrp/NBP35 family ATP-binding protein [Dehalococcoidia bacterium]|nr:Mrp/NBP35 family ATP-binding protein [Dehalococcoidia bacterium]
MPTKEQVTESLDEVLVPGVMRSLTKLNLVRQVAISDEKIDINLASAALSQETQEWLKSKVQDTIRRLPGVKDVNIDFAEMKPKDVNEIKSVIAVMSGKGGVGKSLVAGLAAISLARRGFEVGILDADITGPSIPKMFGITARPTGSETGFLPVLSRLGIEIMSINLLLPHEDDAVIWRGPLIGKAITQFWEEVLWGQLDYLIVDLPPGTADAPLTVMQSLPLSGIIVVFSPQELAAMVVRKAVKMAQEAMHIPILGVVENMSYLVLPDTGKRLEIFGKSRAEEMAKAAGAPLLAQIPIDPQLAHLCDEGDIERYYSGSLDAFADALVKVVAANVM